MPLLVPGILALSRRARYLSFYAFLLSEYESGRLPASNDRLSEWMKRREYEFALAVFLCPRRCEVTGAGVVGANKASPAVRAAPHNAFSRDESVESALGGYGLYYRTPMSDLGLVAKAGTLQGDKPITVDVLRMGKGLNLASEFKRAIEGTAYFKDYFYGLQPTIPANVLRDYAEKACLCRLPEFPVELALARSAILEDGQSQPPAEVDQRRRSIAMLLALAQEDPTVLIDSAAFRERVWWAFERSKDSPTEMARTLTQWAAFVGKEYLQESLSILWSLTCQAGKARQPNDGFLPASLDDALFAPLMPEAPLLVPGGGTLSADREMPTGDFQAAVQAAVGSQTMEQVRVWAVQDGSATAALGLLLTLEARIPSSLHWSREWAGVGAMRSAFQPGLTVSMGLLRDHLASHPSVGETLAWLARRFVISPHESVAYSKYPEFTFRFRWQEGRLYFYNLSPLSPDRFILADDRRASISSIAADLSLWNGSKTSPGLTDAGRTFASEVFA